MPCHIPVDLAFIFSSGEIDDTNFIRQKLALKTIAKAFALSPRESQASILTYGGYAASVTPSQGIDSFSSTEDFLTAINSLRYGRNRGDIREALKLALEKVQCICSWHFRLNKLTLLTKKLKREDNVFPGKYHYILLLCRHNF